MLKNANSLVSVFLVTLNVPLIWEVESSIVCRKLKMFAPVPSMNAINNSDAEAGEALLNRNRPSPSISVWVVESSNSYSKVAPPNCPAGPVAPVAPVGPVTP
jgi:hypothetical protein